MNYDSHEDVLKALKESQEADHDRRELLRELQPFLNAPNGQWEPEIWKQFDGQYRGQFDLCSPIIEDIWDEIADNDFDIRVRPAGGEATKDLAQLRDGLIRNIETMSNASRVYASAGKKAVKYGFAAWRIVQDWADVDAFDQDLFIREVQNAVDRLWFDATATEQDMSDADYCYLLDGVSKREYDKRWPDGKHMSLTTDGSASVYSHKAEKLIVGEFLYKKPITKTLCLMSDGSVLSAEEAEKAAEIGLTIQRTRDRKTYKVCSRFFDGGGWLDDSKDTVFDYLPVIPVYPNFEINEEKVLYRGAIEKHIDAQRVYNYAESRKVSEVALAPRSKIMMTKKQAAGHVEKLSTLNTNSDPVQFYNHVDGEPAPYQTGGPQINPGLSEVSQSMSQNIERSAGVFGVNPTNNKGLQSDIALQRLENKGNAQSKEYFTALEVAICHTGKILIHAIPKMYDTYRQQRVLNEDGSFDIAELNKTVTNRETGLPEKLNDLSIGIYDVTCSIGPAFKNRQQETVKAINELAAIDPTIIGEGKDIMLNNIDAPGMDLLAERVRQAMLMQGLIPESQMTDEEKEQVAAMAQQPQEPSLEDKIGAAELMKAEAQAMKAQLDTVLTQQKQEYEQVNAQIKLQMEQQEQGFEMLKTFAQTLNELRQAMGVEAVVSDDAAQAYEGTAERLNEAVGLPQQNPASPPSAGFFTPE